jgi:iron complex transport system substrate-binding protein
LILALIAGGCGSSDGDDAAASEPTGDTVATAEPAAGADTAEPATAETPAGDASASTAAGDGSGFPVTIESAGGTFVLESAPQRIVSLSPTATEMLFAIDAGDQVVAVDEFSNYPENAPRTDLSGFDPNVEAVLAYEPDLVIISFDANDLVASLTALGIPVLVSDAPVDIESGYGAFADLGLAVGRVDETAAAIATMRADVAAALADAPQRDLRIYHEIDNTFYAASSFGFIGSVYAEMGVTNIADEADTDGYGYPQLSQEYIVEADPELIIITDEVGYTPADVAARPGWDQISAVKNGDIIVVSSDIASRWGPRLPQFIAKVAAALAAVPVGG